MSEVSNEKLLKFVNAMDDLVELGEEVMKDGKIDLGDITSLPQAGRVLSDLIEVGKSYKDMLAELKDLDKDEFKQLVDAALDG